MLRLSCFLIGEDYAQIRNETSDSKQKIALMGIALLVPVLIWFFNGFFLAHIALKHSIGISIGVGIACSFLIYLIDRLILMSSKVGGWMTLARLLLAIAIAVVGAIGIDLVIYNSDINRKLEMSHKAKLDSLDRAFVRADSLDQLKLLAFVKSRQTKRDSLQNLYIQELQGHGSGLRGRGDIAKAIQAQLDTARNDMTKVEGQLRAFNQTSAIRKEQNRKQVVFENGLQLRLRLLHDLVVESWFSKGFFGCLTLIFFMMECSVLIAKSSLNETALDKKRRYVNEYLAEKRLQQS